MGNRVKLHTTRNLHAEARQRILERDGYVCAYCLGEATEVDHVVPWNWSYNDSESNLVAACRDCNRIAQDKVFSSLEEKYKHIQEVRAGKKWKKRLSRSELSTCVHCHKTYKPRLNGSTIFLCSVCANKGWREE
jgi:5-methylcytosine-specific restriction endonuclease McrA